MEMYEYTKLNSNEQKRILKEEGLFLEKYQDGENTIFVYYLDDFFVEVTFKGNLYIDTLPFKRGYKLNKQDLHALAKRNLLYNLAA
jgi:hypothetical protein